MCRHCRVKEEPCEEFLADLEVSHELDRILRLLRHVVDLLGDEVYDDESGDETATETESTASGENSADDGSPKPATRPHTV
jgi:hypothetical protein